MRCHINLLTLFAFVLFCQLGVSQDLSTSKTADPANGKRLFEREWNSVSPERSTRSNNVGLLFNAVSCVACHSQGGVGGSGPVSRNAQLLSVLPSRNRNGGFNLDEDSLEGMFSEAAKIHQDLGGSNGTVLHRFSAVDEYQDWRDRLVWGNAKPQLVEKRNKSLDLRPIHRITRQLPAERRAAKRKPATDITIQVSQRNTPSLFGAGLIEQIPDKSILKIQREQRNFDRDAIEGIVAELPDDTLGKFGWRGQKSSLEEFTIQACAVELGLGTKGQSENDLPVSLIVSNSSLRVGNEIDQQELADMVQFIRQLPPPYENLPNDAKQLEFVEKGAAVFARLNCATCHVKKVAEIDGVYSDFLMHDMGPELADVAGVITTETKTQTQSIGGYFGPSSPVKSKGRKTFTIGSDAFWQTPPLWGIANSAPYMHDGRAKNFHEAIMLHGGEAEESRNAYKRLTAKYRKYLHAYLNTLGAVR